MTLIGDASPSKKIKLSNWNNKNQQDSSSCQDLTEARTKLPIYPVRKELIKYVNTNPSLIVIGETGSGKSTQIPQYLLESSVNGDKGCIGITQPRRVAAVTLASRVQMEMNERKNEWGTKLVGFHVRFETSVTFDTKICYMTDGILLREAIKDQELKKYRIIILDEAHERSISTDVLFGILKNAQKKRQQSNLPLKLIVMSATMDVDHFSNYLNKAPVIYIEGRQFPVNLKYLCEPMPDYEHASLVAIFNIHKKKPPNEGILVFLTGQEEIELAVRKCRETFHELRLKKPNTHKMVVMGLYSSMNTASQMRSFEPVKQNCRKVIFATNIAETSLTIPDISIIIDSGKIKYRDYNPAKRLDYLRVKRTSQASATQRAGRAGRERAGECYRLYTEEEYSTMEKTLTPEILRCNLSSAILELLYMKVNDISEFDLLDKPNEESIQMAIKELEFIGAVTRINEHTSLLNITDRGRTLTTFPLDPKLARMILAANDLGCLDEIIIIVAMLSGENALAFSHAKQEECVTAHQKFSCPEGDHVRMLNIFRAWKSVKQCEAKSWCIENFIIDKSLKTIDRIRNQISEITVSMGLKRSTCGADLVLVRQALCYGLFMNCGILEADGASHKVVISNLNAKIHPSSCLIGCKPGAIVYSELTLTNSVYARECTAVDVKWIQQAAPEFAQIYKID